MVGGGLSLAGASAAAAADGTGPGTVAVCKASTVYVQNSDGDVRAFDVDSSTLADTDTLTGQESNGLGIGASGSTVYTLHNGNPAGAEKQLAIYDSTSGTTLRDIGDPDAPGPIIRGAVNPATGLYYYSGNGDASGHYFGVYDPAVGSGAQVGLITGMTGSNGDFAFTSSGELIVVADRNVYKLDGAVPTTPGERSLTTTHIATLPEGAQGNGIAFGKNGNLFISASSGGNRIFEVNPATGALVKTTSLGSFSPTDMASCSYPSTLALQVDVQGRANPGDQFTVTIGGQDYVSDNPGRVATTTGQQGGIQPEAAGPVFVEPGDDLTLTIAPAGTADLGDYTLVPQCTDATTGDAVAVRGTGPTWTITQPAGGNGSNVVCTISVTPLPKVSTVTVEFVDEAGNPVAESVSSTDEIGAEYLSQPKQIPGYVLVKTPANASGEYAEDDVTVTYVYAKVSTVTVEFVDEAGNPVAESVSSTDEIGAEYSSQPKQIPGYVLVKTPANASGEHGQDDITVRYVYAKAPVAATPTSPAAGPSVNTGGTAIDAPDATWGWVAISAGACLTLLAAGALAFARRGQTRRP